VKLFRLTPINIGNMAAIIGLNTRGPSCFNRAFFHKPNGRQGSASGAKRRGQRIELRPGELSTSMLAAKLKVPAININNAINSGKLKPFVVRTVPYGRGQASIFLKENLESIRTALSQKLRPVRKLQAPSTPHRGPIPLEQGELTSIMLAQKLEINKNTVKNAIRDGRLEPFIKKRVAFGKHQAAIFSVADLDLIKERMQKRPAHFNMEPKRTASQAKAEARPADVAGSIDLPSGIIPKGTTVGKILRNGSIASIGELKEEADLNVDSKFPGMIQCKLEWISQFIRPEDLVIQNEGSWKIPAGFKKEEPLNSL
jgi:hypothetical protein